MTIKGLQKKFKLMASRALRDFRDNNMLKYIPTKVFADTFTTYKIAPTRRSKVLFCFRHSEYEQTQHAFRTSGGINLLAKLLPAAQHWAVIKAACGLMRNLTIIPANLASFKDTGK